YSVTDARAYEILPLSLHDALPISLLCEGRDRRKSLALSSPRRQFLARDGHFSVYPTYQELAKLDRRISARNDHSFAYSAFAAMRDRKSTRLNSSHQIISYAVFCLI